MSVVNSKAMVDTGEKGRTMTAVVTDSVKTNEPASFASPKLGQLKSGKTTNGKGGGEKTDKKTYQDLNEYGQHRVCVSENELKGLRTEYVYGDHPSFLKLNGDWDTKTQITLGKTEYKELCVLRERPWSEEILMKKNGATWYEANKLSDARVAKTVLKHKKARLAREKLLSSGKAVLTKEQADRKSTLRNAKVVETVATVEGEATKKGKLHVKEPLTI